MTAAAKWLDEGYRVSMAWARRGLWHPAEIEIPVRPRAERPSCEACEGTKVFLWGLPLERPCPACARPVAC